MRTSWSRGPDREDRRQGAGARTRGLRLTPSTRHQRGRVMADVTNLRSPPRPAVEAVRILARGVCQRAGHQPRGGVSASSRRPACRAAGSRRSSTRPARRHHRGRPPAEAPRPRTPAKAAVAGATASARSRPRALTFVNGHLVAALSDLDRLPEGVTVTPLNEAMGKAMPASSSSPPSSRCARTGLSAQHRLPGGRRADLGGRRRQARDADPSALRRHRRDVVSRRRPACWSISARARSSSCWRAMRGRPG